MSGANDLIQSILSGMAYLESKKRYLDTENSWLRHLNEIDDLVWSLHDDLDETLNNDNIR